jgi:Methyltransferase domain
MGSPGGRDRPRPDLCGVSAQYNVAAPNGLAARIARYQRRKMFRAFLVFAGAAPSDTVLDIGVTSDRGYDHSNYLEAWYQHKQSITAVGLDDACFLAQDYPGVRFLRADGRELPFRDATFDYVHSSAVLEHVGSRERQVQLLREAWRVSRKGVFFTTPSRWFPVEFHTLLPLLHWLPVRRYRAILAKLGYGFFASEDNLNLLSRRSLAGIANAAGITGQTFATVTVVGWPTNLILSARKDARDHEHPR